MGARRRPGETLVTLEQLKAHLDDRLDAQDDEIRSLRGDVGKLNVGVGKLETALEEKVKAADAKHVSMEKECGGRHGSTAKRVGRLEGLVGLGALAALGAFCKVVWDSVTGKGS